MEFAAYAVVKPSKYHQPFSLIHTDFVNASPMFNHSHSFGLYGNVLQWPPPMAATHRRVTKHGSSYLRVVAAIGGGHCNQDRLHHG